MNKYVLLNLQANMGLATLNVMYTFATPEAHQLILVHSKQPSQSTHRSKGKQSVVLTYAWQYLIACYDNRRSHNSLQL